MNCLNCGVERNSYDTGWYSSSCSVKLRSDGIVGSFCGSSCLDEYEGKKLKKGKK